MLRDTDRHIRTTEDVLTLLDELFAPEADRWTETGADWWDSFYGDRERAVPFFASRPDENLVAVHEEDGTAWAAPATEGSRALDLGCGPGRNSLYLAGRGYAVDAVDLSPKALAWAAERVEEAARAGAPVRVAEEDGPRTPGAVRLHQGNAFQLPALQGPYDLIHDSGCFHHLPPHRRLTYLGFLERHLAPGGHLSLTCFAAGRENSGSELPDTDLYRSAGLHGGLAYTAGSLRAIFSALECVELRPMRERSPETGQFGAPFLWAALFRRPVG